VWNGRKGDNQLPIAGTGSISKRWWQRMRFGYFGQIETGSASGQLLDKKEIHLRSKITATILKTKLCNPVRLFFRDP
jgi:hypothetical protein